MELILRTCYLDTVKINILIHRIYAYEQYKLLQYVEIENIHEFLKNSLDRHVMFNYGCIIGFFPEILDYAIHMWLPFEYLKKIEEIKREFEEWYNDIDNKNYNYDIFSKIYILSYVDKNKYYKYLDFLDNNYPNIFFETIKKCCLFNPEQVFRYLLSRNLEYAGYVIQ